MSRNVLALLALVGMGAGWWLIHPGLGLIIPSTIVFAALVWTHLRGGDGPPDEPSE